MLPNSAAAHDVRLQTPHSLYLFLGKPPLWTPPVVTPQLRQDSGSYLRDKNAARYPKHPIEPAVVACLRADPQLPNNVDLVACSSTLGSLLRFIREEDKQFRMLVEKLKNTVFLIRRENSPTELIPDVRGFGHTFPEAYTTWEPDAGGSDTHTRLLRYKFGGLNLVVRYGADGYIKDSTAEPAVTQSPATDIKGKSTSIDDLTSALSGISVSSALPNPESALRVEPAGTIVVQKHTFDLKTRSIYTKGKKDHLADELPRLWLTQTPNFILAYHTQGYFSPGDIQIRDVRPDVEHWEKSESGQLGRLAALVHQIVELVSDAPHNKLELRCHEAGMLEVREQLPDAGGVLSDEVRVRWEATPGPVVEGPYLVEDWSSEDGNYDDYYREWDEESEKDFTACSADDCGYCGHCDY